MRLLYGTYAMTHVTTSERVKGVRSRIDPNAACSVIVMRMDEVLQEDS